MEGLLVTGYFQIVTTTQQGRYYSPHFAEEETEVQRRVTNVPQARSGENKCVSQVGITLEQRLHAFIPSCCPGLELPESSD